ncbi:unnamed protein product [Gadus morhua 'NCC']
MPHYLEDPSTLTKEKLKNELLINNVELPVSSAPKDVYVQLYLKHLTVQNTRSGGALDGGTTLDGFSSDEDLPPPVVVSRSSGRKAIRKTDKVQMEDLDVAELTAEGLKEELMKYGVDAGPIVASTRRVYEKKLQRLQEENISPATPELPPIVMETEAHHNGHADLDFSDKEDEEVLVVPVPEPEVIPEPEPLPEPIPIVERLVRSRGKIPVTTRTRSSQHHKVEKVVVAEPTQRAEVRDILKEVFANDFNSPSGILASCRKPIRGAAGRPIQPSDFWQDENLLLSPKNLSTTTTTTTSFSETRHRSSNLFPSTHSSSSSSSSSSSAPAAPRLVLAAPPAGHAPAVRRGLSVWLKLFLLVLLVAFLFFVYQTMEAEVLSPFSRSEAEPTGTTEGVA